MSGEYEPREPLRLAMVGGGPGALIGAVHRTAALMDGEFVLVAGAFSSDAARSAERGAQWGLERERVHGDWRELLAREAALPPEVRAQVVAVVTPNHLHHEVAIAALEAGFDVVCDKPMTTSSERADAMAAAVERTGRRFLLTHNYSGYPLVREARELVASGFLGEVRRVDAVYLQGWLAHPLERDGNKQASWRTDPAKAGPGGALGDIGTHAFHLAEFVSGQRVARLLGRCRAFVDGRQLDDDADALLEFDRGASGSLRCSQVCVGRENGLELSVFGTKAGLHWRQEHPNDLVLFRPDGGHEVRRPGNSNLTAAAALATRTPAGHPEGYLEAFANLYSDLAAAIRADRPLPDDLPSVDDGVRGVRFVEAVVGTPIRRWAEL